MSSEINLSQCFNLEEAAYAVYRYVYTDVPNFGGEHQTNFDNLISLFINDYPERINIDVNNVDAFNTVMIQAFERAFQDMVKEILEELVQDGFVNKNDKDGYEFSSLGNDVKDYL